MTAQELLNLVDGFYPNAETDATKISYMNIAIRSLSPYFGIMKEDDSLVTVEDQDYYDFPTGIDDISQITVLNIGTKESPDTRYEYTRYYPSVSEDNPAQNNSFWQIIDSDGNKKLAIYPAPTVAYLPIVIKYKSRITELATDSLYDEPEFNSYYHDMLAFYCVHAICASGASADRVQADVYMQKYDSRLAELKKEMMLRKLKQKNKYTCNQQWIKYRTTGVGY